MLNLKILLMLISIFGSIVVLPRTFDTHESCETIVDPVTGIQSELCYAYPGYIPPSMTPETTASTPGYRPIGSPPKKRPAQDNLLPPSEEISLPAQDNQLPPSEEIPLPAQDNQLPPSEEIPSQNSVAALQIPELPTQDIPQQPEDAPEPPENTLSQPPVQTSQIASTLDLENPPAETLPIKNASINNLLSPPDLTVGTDNAQCHFIRLNDQTPQSHPRDYAGSVMAIFSQEDCNGCEYINKRVTNICSFYPNVTFIEIDNRYRAGYELFKKHLIVFTPTVIMYHNGEQVLRVTGANRDCFEITTRIAQKWYTQQGRRSDVEAAIQGDLQCGAANTACHLDSECVKKLRRLLKKLPM